jgi:hypothetical protein
MLTIVEEAAAKEALDKAREQWPRAQDAWDAITWTLAHDPGFGTPLRESGALRTAVVEGARSIGLPTLQVIYETQAPYIIFHAAIFSEAAAPRAGHA